ncbi:MAG: hypothetical protein WKF55_04055, partial [Gemmatimonadaceae bacterium]
DSHSSTAAPPEFQLDLGLTRDQVSLTYLVTYSRCTIVLRGMEIRFPRTINFTSLIERKLESESSAGSRERKGTTP